MTIVAIMAGFAFGYSVTDIILNIRANRKIDEFVKSIERDTYKENLDD